jgi:hypothetical protein
MLFMLGTLPAFGRLSIPAAVAEEDVDLAKASQKTNNPVCDARLLITQYDSTRLGGDAIDESE